MTGMWKRRSSRHAEASIQHRVNNILTIGVIVLGLYISLGSLLPQATWWLQHHNDSKVPPAALVKTPLIRSSKANEAPIPDSDLLVIPRLRMSEVIHTGAFASELNKGVWHIPASSTPDKASNTVIIGHRFTYAGPAVFYYLDKVQLGDQIIVDWQHKEYTYQVASIKEVSPTELSVEQASPGPELTLYTCTPLWTAKNRLVLVAPLQGVRS